MPFLVAENAVEYGSSKGSAYDSSLKSERPSEMENQGQKHQGGIKPMMEMELVSFKMKNKGIYPAFLPCFLSRQKFGGNVSQGHADENLKGNEESESPY
jgi:hypothetical protein